MTSWKCSCQIRRSGHLASTQRLPLKALGKDAMDSSDIQMCNLFYLTDVEAVNVKDPTLAQVLDVLLAMDGQDADSMSVKLNTGDSMDVEGGLDGQYKCHARTRAGFFHLVNPSTPKDMSDMVYLQTGGEGTEFPRCCIISLSCARAAVECFCATGDLNPKLGWDNTLDFDPL